MKLDNALKDVNVLGFDTAPIIYFVEQHANYIDLMHVVIQRIDRGEIVGCSSVVTLVEVLSYPIKLGYGKIEDEYRDLLLHSRNFSMTEITVEIAHKAALLRAQYNLRTPDALQIAASMVSGCQAFLTNDLTLKRVSDLRVLVLDELEL
jgi:predicted nucleic acid-binding protein